MSGFSKKKQKQLTELDFLPGSHPDVKALKEATARHKPKKMGTDELKQALLRIHKKA